MKFPYVFAFAVIATCLLSSCGGGSSSSGPDINVVIPDLSGSIAGPSIGAEFKADRCIDASVSLEGTTVINSCPENVNVREISNNEFGPNFLIAGNTTRIIPGVRVPLVACFAPKIPGGIADLLKFQCL